MGNTYLPNRAGDLARQRDSLLSRSITVEPQIALLSERFQRWERDESPDCDGLPSMVREFLAAVRISSREGGSA